MPARLLALACIAVSLVAGLGHPLPLTLAQGYVLHFTGGAILAWAVGQLLGGRRLAGLLVVAAGAIVLEIVQGSFLPGRTADVVDAVAGIAGALLSTVVRAVARR